MRRLAIIGSLMLLGACSASVESERPLFLPGPGSFKPGMWAAMPITKPCELPRDTDIFTWPNCATPVLMKSGTATYFAPAPFTTTFDIADGAPRIIQADKDIMGGWIDQSEKAVVPNLDRRFYASFYPTSDAPFTAGRIQFLSCPTRSEPAEPLGKRTPKAKKVEETKPIAGLRPVDIGDDTHCIADTPDAVREVARRAPPEDASLRLVWIGSYP